MRVWHRPLNRATAVALLIAAVAAGCGGSSGVDDRANELPFGHVDVPVDGARVEAQTPIAGWALDDRGVREIRVYVDGRIVNHGPLTNERPDVSKAYPQYARRGNQHGWTLTMDFAVPGSHAVLVQAVDSDGATRDIGALHVTAVDR
jgi:Bacterial Ig domain